MRSYGLQIGIFSMALVALMVVAPVVMAAEEMIYQCDGDNGEPVFSNLRCETNQRIISLGEMSVIPASSAQSLRKQTKAVRALPGDTRLEKKLRRTAASSKEQQAKTFGERVELRKLRMRAEGLRRDLRRAVSGNARIALKKALHDVERKLKQLEG